ncbi:MAG: hypothetical protein ACI9DE_001086, partial [Halioglobus sp.]
ARQHFVERVTIAVGGAEERHRQDRCAVAFTELLVELLDGFDAFDSLISRAWRSASPIASACLANDMLRSGAKLGMSLKQCLVDKQMRIPNGRPATCGTTW